MSRKPDPQQEEVFAAPGSAVDFLPPDTGSDPGSQLLARSRAAWELGDWDVLATLAETPLEDNRDRARLALLAAVGLAQLGRMDQAQSYARQAQDWGCPATLMARVLVGGALNSLGRVASLCGDSARSRTFFQTSVGVVSPRLDTALIGQARGQLEHMRLGLAVAAVDPPLVSLSGKPPRATPPEEGKGLRPPYQDSPFFSMPALNRLQAQLAKAAQGPYLLETKSIPRTGLHFVQNTLELVLEEKYSFCEWYNEPGCCKKMPCAITPHLLNDPAATQGMLRLTKSHDFDLKDPIYPLSAGIERLVLVRDPVFSLTSWWILDELHRHKELLLAHDISMQRINFRHEPKVVKAAMHILDAHYQDPAPATLSEWLEKKTIYMALFAEKWAPDVAGASNPGAKLVVYDELPSYLTDLVRRKVAGFPDRQKRTCLALLKKQLEGFKPRKSPFSTAPSKVQGFVYQHQKAFRDASADLLAYDKTGFFTGLHLEV